MSTQPDLGITTDGIEIHPVGKLSFRRFCVHDYNYARESGVGVLLEDEIGAGFRQAVVMRSGQSREQVAMALERLAAFVRTGTDGRWVLDCDQLAGQEIQPLDNMAAGRNTLLTRLATAGTRQEQPAEPA